MKIENLKVGQSYKYKELCEVLGIKPTSKANNSREAQFKELDTLCKYKKQGHSIIIKKIYAEQGEKMDKRKQGNNNDISKNLRYMILDLLSRHNQENQDENCEIGFSKILLYRHCGMINHNYRNAKGNLKAWANELNISEIAIEECLDYTDDRLRTTVRRACSTLQSSNKALSYRMGYNYILKGEENELDKHYTATQDIQEDIRNAEYEIMEQMSIRSYDYINKYGRWNEFKAKVMDKLRTEYPLEFGNIKYYYNAIVLSFKPSIINHCKARFEERFELNLSIAKANVNKYFSESLDKTIENRHEKVLKNNGFGKNFDSIDDYRSEEIYIPEQKESKDSVIKLGYKQLEFKLNTNVDMDDENIPF